MQATQPGDALVPGSQRQVIGVAQDDLRAGGMRRSPGVRLLTVACVPTGMNCGVSIAPCGVVEAAEPRAGRRRSRAT